MWHAHHAHNQMKWPRHTYFLNIPFTSKLSAKAIRFICMFCSSWLFLVCVQSIAIFAVLFVCFAIMYKYMPYNLWQPWFGASMYVLYKSQSFFSASSFARFFLTLSLSLFRFLFPWGQQYLNNTKVTSLWRSRQLWPITHSIHTSKHKFVPICLFCLLFVHRCILSFWRWLLFAPAPKCMSHHKQTKFVRFC